ncbi:hypothetical protein MTR67_030977 [Solanum verrucosum]|uniref:Uncharacterized protein n=1 Tax=Solanum verrucosum TaxID=315347 RepID=A0AAF0ZE77_SOLVR|nr:hypothetical protein MTR67_030977 [Solanum verrucosum]
MVVLSLMLQLFLKERKMRGLTWIRVLGFLSNLRVSMKLGRKWVEAILGILVLLLSRKVNLRVRKLLLRSFQKPRSVALKCICILKLPTIFYC